MWFSDCFVFFKIKVSRKKYVWSSTFFCQVSSASESEKKEAADLRMALEQQMDQLRIAHQQQVASLRDEIAEKQQLINDIRE